jgi:hypothetical protein
MKWKVNLIGDDVVLKSLCSDFNPTKELNIFKEGDQFFMTHKEFEKLTTSDDVRRFSVEIIELINGISFHLNAKKGTISSNSISKLNDQGGNDVFVFAETSIIYLSSNQPTIIITNEDGSTTYSSPLTTIENLLTDAKTNPSKATIFRLFANGNLDWVSLYRLYEVIYSDVGNLIFSWTNKKTIQNFKHTCNSIGAIGDASRHGIEITNPPKKPMTLMDAQNLIKLIIDKYLEKK